MKIILYIENDNDYFGMSLLGGFVQESKKKEWWNTLILPALSCHDSNVDDLLDQADGFVTRGADKELISKIDTLKKPHLVLRASASLAPTAAPHVDDHEIGRVAYDEIMHLGGVNQAFLGYKDVIWSDARRRSFFETATTRAELLLKLDQEDSSAGLAEVMSWLMSLPKPVAIFAASDELAIKVTQAALLAKINIPQDVSIIGADNNIELCDNSIVTLSSIDPHPGIIGRKCAWAMAQKMGFIESLEEQPILRPPELVIRQSSHPVTKHFVIYKSAISWINRNALSGPSVDELADVSNVSRRSLERIFDKVANVSPANVIREKRMKAILHLLTADDIPLSHLARRAGFSDQSSFSNFITRNTGETPTSIRGRAREGK
ncbi:helix-turn-helix domain-containing protein [Akkermansiaceae bacterium]|nr:helix-turn-helix domain-containing protein [Akkermansiaceae bacterium]